MSEACEATARFLEAAEARKATVIRVATDGVDTQLERSSVAIAWLGSLSARRLLVHVSGVHGVEGLAGSVVQTELLRRAPQPAGDTAAVWIQGVNRFGMEQLRRTNAANVDLNRNCLEDPERYRGSDPLYASLAWLVLPGKRSRNRPFAWYVARLLIWAVRYGRSRLAQAIAAGQYDYPTGLFYGGSGLAGETAALLRWAEEHFRRRTVVGIIDFHTGLGRFGHSLVLGDCVVSGPARQESESPAGVNRNMASTAAYTARGELVAALARSCSGALVRRCTHEVGTYSMIRILWVLSEENHFWHYDSTGFQSILWRKRLKEMFFPEISAWQNAVLRESYKVWQKWMEWVGRN